MTSEWSSGGSAAGGRRQAAGGRLQAEAGGAAAGGTLEAGRTEHPTFNTELPTPKTGGTFNFECRLPARTSSRLWKTSHVDERYLLNQRLSVHGVPIAKHAWLGDFQETPRTSAAIPLQPSSALKVRCSSGLQPWEFDVGCSMFLRPTGCRWLVGGGCQRVRRRRRRCCDCGRSGYAMTRRPGHRCWWPCPWRSAGGSPARSLPLVQWIVV